MRPGDTRFLPQLARYRAAGFRIVGMNVGWDAMPWAQTLEMLALFRRYLRSHSDEFRQVETPWDLAANDERLGVFFDIEGGVALNGRLEMVELYRDLGVRWMLIAYNRNNALGGGCQDTDRGLTKFGRQVVAEMERVGITVDCTHTGYRTTMDVMRLATRPVIFSHSNPLGLVKHKRNIRDEAIRACAATDGVVGINGIGPFLGYNDNRSETVVTHIDYVAQLVGVDHVGLGLDYVFDSKELDDVVTAHPELFPPSEGYTGGVKMVAPEQLPEIVAGLIARGYRSADIRKILGGNFARVARATWPKQPAFPRSPRSSGL